MAQEIWGGFTDEPAPNNNKVFSGILKIPLPLSPTRGPERTRSPAKENPRSGLGLKRANSRALSSLEDIEVLHSHRSLVGKRRKVHRCDPACTISVVK
jgi:hypothetical protein